MTIPDAVLLFVAFCVGAFSGGFTRAVWRSFTPATEYLLTEEVTLHGLRVVVSVRAPTADEAQRQLALLRAQLYPIREVEP